MDEQKSQIRTLSRRTIDLLFAKEPGSTTPPSMMYAKPLRIIIGAQLGVLVDGRVYPLYEDQDEQYLAYEKLESFEERNCALPDLKQEYQIRTIGVPRKSDSVHELKVNASNFGLHIRIKCDDTFVESFVEKLVNDKGIKVIKWDAVDEEGEYNWQIDLPPGLNLSRITERITAIADEVSDEIAPDLHQEELSKLQKKINRLEQERIDYSSKTQADFQRLTGELKSAYEQITELVRERSEVGVEQNKISAISLKRTKGEKMITSILKAIYPNLALSPDTPSIVLEKFLNSNALWKELAKLDNRELQNIHRLKKLRGAAGKAGWSELQVHISSGQDSRGRIYARKSKHSHLYDVAIHWKQNELEQNRFMIKIANYSPFRSNNVIEGKSERQA